MTTTTFTDYATRVPASWLNDVNDRIYEDVYNVKNYGATGDGTTDDGTAIENAVTAMKAAGGGILFFPPGTYKVNTVTNFTLGSKVTLWGYGAVLDFSSNSTVAVARLRVDGAFGSNVSLSANASAGSSTFTVSSATGLSAGDWLRISSSDLVPLADIGGSTTQTIGEFVRIASISGTTVTIDGYLIGTYLTADSAKINKLSTAAEGAIFGIRVIGTGVTGTDTSSLEIGIQGKYCKSFTVKDCLVEYCDYHSIRVEQTVNFSVDANRVVFEPRANVAHTAVIQYGISMVGTTMAGTVTGNSVWGGKHGIVWSENSEGGIGRGVTVDSNYINGTWAAAISTHESNEQANITNNKIVACERGLDIRVANMVIEGNDIRGVGTAANLEDGIYLSENAKNLIIANNNIQGMRYGIRGYNTGFPTNAVPTNLSIHSNIILDIDQIGIYLQQTQNATGFTGLAINNNNIRGFGTDGVRLDGEFLRAKISENNFIRDSAPAGYGVRLMGTNKTRVTGNSFVNMTPVRLEVDNQSVPASPRNPLIINNDWDHTTGFLSSTAGTFIVNQDNIENGDTSVTIATGVITVPAGVRYILVDTESAAASDDLDTINGGNTGDFIILKAASDARTVVVKDNTGNLQLNGDFSLTDSDDTIILFWNGAQWHEASRSDNTA